MITATCGYHCGIRSNAEGTVRTEGHCGCEDCSCPQAGTYALPRFPSKTPMCGRWYSATGERPPWDQS